MFDLDHLSGVLVALASPLKRDGRVDQPAIKRLVDHVLAGGVTGLVPLGSTGETAALDEPSRRTILLGVLEAGAGRVPVICGVAQSTLAAARAEVQAAAELGADAVLVAPPFYYPMSQTAVLSFYRQLAWDAKLPIFVYNIPQFTKVVIEPPTVRELAQEDAIRGIKDSSRDFEYFEAVCFQMQEFERFRIFTGSDTMLLASLVVGAAGTICGAGNVAPEMVVRIYHEYRHGDLERARVSQDALFELVMALRQGVFPLGIKAALHAQGLCEPWSAPPVQALPEASVASLRKKLGWFGLVQEDGLVRS